MIVRLGFDEQGLMIHESIDQVVNCEVMHCKLLQVDFLVGQLINFPCKRTVKLVHFCLVFTLGTRFAKLMAKTFCSTKKVKFAGSHFLNIFTISVPIWPILPQAAQRGLFL